MASCSKYFSTEEIKDLVTGSDSAKETYKIRSQKRTSSHITTPVVGDVIIPTRRFYGEPTRFKLLKDVLTYIDASEINPRTLTVLPPESGDQNVPTDEEDDVRGTSLLPPEVAGELHVDLERGCTEDEEDEYFLPRKAKESKKSNGQRKGKKKSCKREQKKIKMLKIQIGRKIHHSLFL